MSTEPSTVHLRDVQYPGASLNDPPIPGLEIQLSHIDTSRLDIDETVAPNGEPITEYGAYGTTRAHLHIAVLIYPNVDYTGTPIYYNPNPLLPSEPINKGNYWDTYSDLPEGP